MEKILKFKSYGTAGRPLSEGFSRTELCQIREAHRSRRRDWYTGQSLQEISEYFDYKATLTLKTLTALLEPIMLVLVGAAGWHVLRLLLQFMASLVKSTR
jgi:hypothetical protein